MGQIRRIVPLSEFKKKLDEFIGELSSTAQPIMVTRHGRGVFVVQCPDSFAENSDLADHARHQLWATQGDDNTGR